MKLKGPPKAEIFFSFSRSSGPGGQHVNKTNTRATLNWHVAASPSLPDPIKERFLKKYGHRISKEGVLALHSQKHRLRQRNVEECQARLMNMLATIWQPPKKRRPTRPTKAAKERRLEKKRRRSQKKSWRRKPSEVD